jgi:transcriptional regulator with XRE-family HTH domain
MNDEARTPTETNWQLDWGRLLRTARQVAGMSLSELSAATGISKGHLSKLESGYEAAQNPSRATLAALARALPSFGPLAHTLEPAQMTSGLALGVAAPELPEVAPDEQGTVSESPVSLGWRELEVVLALLTLEQAAVTQPLTALLIARALNRPVASVAPTIEQLIAMGVLDACPPHRQSGPVTYRRAPEFEARVGIARVGDVLVLAAALLSQAPLLSRRASSEETRVKLWNER